MIAENRWLSEDQICNIAKSLWNGNFEVVAVCVMPDHVHAMTRHSNREAFGAVVSAWTRWRNAGRGVRGRAVMRIPEPHHLATRDKIRRSERYIHLNPCRARLVHDPLAWPLSSYRDAVGLGLRPCRAASHEPNRLHRYTVEDESVTADTSFLPNTHLGEPSVGEVGDAVAALYRAPRSALRGRGEVRTTFIRAARVLTTATAGVIGEACGVTDRSVRAVAATRTDETVLVSRICRDPRLVPLDSGPLRTTPGATAFMVRCPWW